MLLTLVYTIVWMFSDSYAILQRDFVVKMNHKLTGGTLLGSFNRSGMNTLLCLSKCGQTCHSAMYSTTYNSCAVFQEHLYDTNIAWEPNTHWNVLIGKRGNTVKYGDWTLVFRAQNGTNTSVYDLWTSAGVSHDNPVTDETPPSCHGLAHDASCTQHFRSHILDNWVGISQVRFSLYKDGQEMRNLTFNGQSTTRDSWFTKNGVLSNTWDSTFITPNRFSIGGYTDDSSQRRFCISYIPYLLVSCSAVTTYTMVIDSPTDSCSKMWDLDPSNYPMFVYSGDSYLPASLVYSGLLEYRMADVMAVFVKF